MSDSEKISEYEKRAWKRLLETSTPRARPVRDVVGRNLRKVGDKARDVLTSTGAGQRAMDLSEVALKKSMEGRYAAIFVPAIRSLPVEARVKRARKAGLAVQSLAGLREQDLEDVDRDRPRLKYTGALAAESGLSALAVTGAQVATTVSGGASAGVAVGAVATDAAATLALLARSVADVALHFGYDPRQPEKEQYLMAVLNFSTAGGNAAKAAALQSVSRLTQRMVRQATWKQLEQELLVKLIREIFVALGVRLTHRKLAQVVPFAGVAINVALAVALMEAVRDATRVYRLRFLAEKYGLDADEAFRAYATATRPDGDTGDEEIIEVELVG